MRFKLIDEAKKQFPVHRLCNVLDVSESGYFAWKGRPASRRQNEDLVLLAHIRAQFSTSSETYGSPRMHSELKEEGLAVGRHRVARLMRDNGLKALQKRRYTPQTRIERLTEQARGVRKIRASSARKSGRHHPGIPGDFVGIRIGDVQAAQDNLPGALEA